MSDKMTCDIHDLVAIADVVRSLNGSEQKYYLDELVTETQRIGKPVEIATPFITVDNNGLITATINQNAGFVKTGTKTVTKQMEVSGGAEKLVELRMESIRMSEEPSFMDTYEVYYIDSLSKETKIYSIHNHEPGFYEVVQVQSGSPIVVNYIEGVQHFENNLITIYEKANYDGSYTRVYAAPESGMANLGMYV